MAAFTLSVPITKLTSKSSFELKVKELVELKDEAHNHLRKLNVLKLRYTDWFNNRHRTFIDSLRFICIALHQPVTQETATVGNFRKCYEITSKIPKTGMPIERCVANFGEYFEFWDQLLKLHDEGQDFHKKIVHYSKSVSCMSEPQLNDSVNQLQSRLDNEIDEKFNFLTIENTTDNLYTYKAAPHEGIFQALLSYIPYLLKTSSTICFLCTKMLLEKE